MDVGDGSDALGDVTNGNDDAAALSDALVGCTEWHAEGTLNSSDLKLLSAE